MKYAKLIDGDIFFAPKKIKHGNSTTYNPPAEMLTELGYLPVIFTEPPTVEEGYEAVSTWEEIDGEIVQQWEVVIAEPTAEELLAILLGDEA